MNRGVPKPIYPGHYYDKAVPAPREQVEKSYKGGLKAMFARVDALIKQAETGGQTPEGEPDDEPDNEDESKPKAEFADINKLHQPKGAVEGKGGQFAEKRGAAAVAVETAKRAGAARKAAGQEVTGAAGKAAGGKTAAGAAVAAAGAKAAPAASGEAAAAEAKASAEPLKGLHPGSNPFKVSPSVTKTLKRTLDHEKVYVATGLKQMSADAEVFAHNMSLFKVRAMYPGLRPEELSGTPEEIYQNVKSTIKAHLLFLYTHASDEEKQAIAWYLGANNLIKETADQHALPVQSVAAVYASLSPQKDWDENLYLAKALTDIYMTKQDHVWDDSMTATLEAIDATRAKQGDLPLYNAKTLAEIKGKKLGELENPDAKARWIRIYDQTYNYYEETARAGKDKGKLKRYRAYHKFQADGTMSEDVARNDDGTPSEVTWGPASLGAAGIKALESGGDRVIISRAIPQKHKVRNFYNNLLDPLGLDGDVTIDTHAVGAGWMRQITGADGAVIHGLSGSPKAAEYPEGWVPSKNSTANGAYGLYGIYADAYREVATELGLLPSDFQAIAWVVKRNAFVDLPKAEIKKIDALWNDYHDGGSTLAETQEAVWQITVAARKAKMVKT